MKPRIKSARKLALFLFFIAVSLAHADVKLRIYLKDGSLQAGNLVAENKTSFVILSRDGRVEVSKDQIMFVNGKTLQQWEARPDKLYQTEILPSDVPNPSYVTDKAALEAAKVGASSASGAASEDGDAPSTRGASSGSSRPKQAQPLDSDTAATSPMRPSSGGVAKKSRASSSSPSSSSEPSEAAQAATVSPAVGGGGGGPVIESVKPLSAMKAVAAKRSAKKNPPAPSNSAPAATSDAASAASQGAVSTSGTSLTAAAGSYAVTGLTPSSGATSLRAASASPGAGSAARAGSGVAPGVGDGASNALITPIAAAHVKGRTKSKHGRRAGRRVRETTPVSDEEGSQATTATGDRGALIPDSVNRTSGAKASSLKPSGAGEGASAAAANAPVASISSAGSSKFHAIVAYVKKMARAVKRRLVRLTKKGTTASPASTPAIKPSGVNPMPAARPMAGSAAGIESAQLPSQSARSAGSIGMAGHARPIQPGYFDRENFSSYHYQNAVELLQSGERGRAMQELHLAAILNRRNPEPWLLLGKLYSEAGMTAQAQKYLGHPGLNKREEVKAILESVAADSATEQQRPWVLYGSSALGLFSMVPLIWLKRRVSSGAKAPRERILESPVQPQEEVIEQSHAAVMEEILASALSSKEIEEKIETDAPVRPAFDVDETLPLPPAAPAFSAEVSVPPAEIVPPPETSQLIEKLARKVPPPETIERPIPVPAKMPERETAPLEPAVPVSAAKTAGQEYDEILELAGTVDRWLQDGNRFAVEGEMNLARRAYRTALVLRGNCVEALVGLGYVCFAEGKWELALQHYVRALEIDPNSADAHYGIGRALLETDRVTEAIPEFEQTLALDPTFDDARDTLTALGQAA